MLLDGKVYHHTYKYDDEFKDLAEVYKNQTLSQTDYNTYLLAYDIGNKNPKDARLKISNLIGNDYVYLDFKTHSFTKNNKTQEYGIGSEVDLKDTNLENTKFNIKSALIEDKHTLNYRYCVNSDECIDSIEYLRPDYYHTGVPKTILRIEYDFESTDINSFYKLISVYGSLEYVVDGTKKVQQVPFKNIKSLRVKEDNILNLEVVKDIEDATEVYLVFNIRNNQIRYKIK